MSAASRKFTGQRGAGPRRRPAGSGPAEPERVLDDEFFDEEKSLNEGEPGQNGANVEDSDVESGDSRYGEAGDEEEEVDRAAAASRVRAPKPPKKPGVFRRLYYGTTNIDFLGMRNKWFIFSLLLILAGLGSLLVRPMNFGIDFRGGTSWEMPTRKDVGQIRAVLTPMGYGDAKIQRIGEDHVRVQGDVRGNQPDEREAETKRVRDALAQVTGTEVSVSSVGASWGGEITRKALIALAVFFTVIFLYLMLKFEWRLAVGAMSAVVHDIFMTIGLYALIGLEVTPASVIAFLTILGYSLYDTVVVFDKLDENASVVAKSGKYRYSDVTNLSLNQTLMRSLNTSISSALPVLSVVVVGSLLLGAKTLEDFGVALLVGMVTGAYSSVFIAAPVAAMLKERDPKWRVIRENLEAKGVPNARPREMAVALAAPTNARLRGPRGRTTVVPTGRRQAPTGRLVLARAEGEDFLLGHDRAPEDGAEVVDDMKAAVSTFGGRPSPVNFTRTSRQGGGGKTPQGPTPRGSGKGKAKSKGKGR